ncbi:recombinase-like helix-turn-helix domain-containing protein [Ochrobactrum sp. GPK 3]|uniref:recombinase-like helix-turn-helix domain-containing protein n=1 Tax=Brucella sp. 22210 TaxID=3453892 RepID=UPI0031385F2C
MFNDMLSRHAEATGSASLAHQCRGRAMTPDEQALADVISAFYAEMGHDFQALAGELNRLEIAKPHSGGSQWTLEELENELKLINAELDAAYKENGYGA